MFYHNFEVIDCSYYCCGEFARHEMNVERFQGDNTHITMRELEVRRISVQFNLNDIYAFFMRDMKDDGIPML